MELAIKKFYKGRKKIKEISRQIPLVEKKIEKTNILKYPSAIFYLLPIFGIEIKNIEFDVRGKKLEGLIYKPTGNGKYPLVAFDAGLRTGVHELPLLAAAIARMGYVVFGTRSRMEVTRLEAEDYLYGIEFVKKLGFVSGKTALAGISSGASIMLLVASLIDEGKANCVIAMAPYANLSKAYYYAKNYVSTHDSSDHRTKVLQSYLNYSEEVMKTPERAPGEYFLASPINFIHYIKIPALLVHGIDDKIVPVENSIEIYNKMKDVGKDVKLKVTQGEGAHAPEEEMLSDLPDTIGLIETVAQVGNFLKKHIG